MAELKGMPRPYAELATSTRDVTKCRETGLQRPPDHLLWPVFPLVNPAHSYVWSAQSGSVGGEVIWLVLLLAFGCNALVIVLHFPIHICLAPAQNRCDEGGNLARRRQTPIPGLDGDAGTPRQNVVEM